MPSGMRDLDWVVNPSTWGADNTGIVMGPNTIIGVGLHLNLAGALFGQGGAAELAQARLAAATFESGDNMVLERIRGQILLFPNNEVWNDQTPYLSTYHLRIRLGEMNPLDGGPVAPDIEYDLVEPWTANEEFLWHHVEPVSNFASWWDPDSIVRVSPRFAIDVNVKTRRRVQQLQQVQLIAQWSDLQGNAPGGARFTLVPYLRCLFSSR